MEEGSIPPAARCGADPSRRCPTSTSPHSSARPHSRADWFPTPTALVAESWSPSVLFGGVVFAGWTVLVHDLATTSESLSDTD